MDKLQAVLMTIIAVMASLTGLGLVFNILLAPVKQSQVTLENNQVKLERNQMNLEKNQKNLERKLDQVLLKLK